MRAALLLLSIAACAAPAPSAAPPPAAPPPAFELRHTFLTSGRPTGFMVETREADGSRSVKFKFDDRGRGPDVAVRVWTGDDEIAERIEVRGVDYYKIAVKEDFVREGDRIRWDNASEHAERTVEGPAFYLGLNGAPEERGRLARALLATESKKLELLPAGEAAIESLGTQEVTREGETKTVTLYAIRGIGFDPDLMWLENDGTLFASVGDWASVIREGWEKSVEPLLSRQKELESARLKELAVRLTGHPKGPVAFKRGASSIRCSARCCPGRS